MGEASKADDREPRVEYRVHVGVILGTLVTGTTLGSKLALL